MAVLGRRRVLWSAVGLAAAFAAACPLALPIAPMLPERGGTACFAATFEGGRALQRGWAHHSSWPAQVTRMAVRIVHPPDERPYRDPGTGYGYDWRYAVYVEVGVKDRVRAYSAPTSCNWTRHPVNAVVPTLGCAIDCDGGAIELRRVPGRRAIDVVWTAGSHLRMSACGGGGEILRGGNTTQVFRLDLVPPSECGAAGP